MNQHHAALKVGQLAERLAEGYFAHAAAIAAATHPNAQALAPLALPGHLVPLGFVSRKDGTTHAFHFTHFLQMASTNPEITGELPRVWLAGSLVTLGDALSLHSYFDHAPVLELIYHLRNGVAHGNRFKFTQRGLQRLQDYPAHNRWALIKGDLKEIFEIAPALEGQTVLFSYLGAGNVLDILMSAGNHLIRLGNGDPLPPSSGT